MNNKSTSLNYRYSIILLVAITLLSVNISNYAQQQNQIQSINLTSSASSIKIDNIKEGPLKKAGGQLTALLEEFNLHESSNSATAFTSMNSQSTIANNNVLVDITASGDPLVLEQELKELGMKVSGLAGPIISGLLPINLIDEVAALDDVNFFRSSMYLTNIGLTTSQGDASMYSDVVRSSLGIDGSGVIVGVLSDSYDTRTTAITHAADDVASGDLPGTTNPNGYTTPVNVLEDLPNGSDEGRAMLQIIHDVAPGAELAIASAGGGQAVFANNITALRTTGNADVIVDDIYYYSEPMFQDGIIAQAADAAYAAGVPYFSAAGNQGLDSYSSSWRSGPADTIQGYPFISTFDFDPGPDVDNLQDFTIAGYSRFTIALQWDSPFSSVCAGCPGSQNDIDIFLTDPTGSTVYAVGGDNNINGDAYEYISYYNYGAAAVPVAIKICKFSGPDPGSIKYINYGAAQGSLEYRIAGRTIVGHAGAIGALAVGAAPYYYTPAFGVTPPKLENFSSWGPTFIYFKTDGSPTWEIRRDKPAITAPDGVNTTFFGSDISIDTDTYPNFFGTSAAAPHAAAVAALMLEVNGSLTPAQLYANMKAGAVDMGLSNGAGSGLINANDITSLPVELTTFSANIVDNTAILNWETATEVNNYGFEVERHASTPLSMNSSRAETRDWEKVSFVEGHGNSNSPKYYSFTDKSIQASGKYLYRLKQIDIDGTFEYSDEVEISLGSPNNFELSQNYPNPFNPSTSIKYSIPSDARVTLAIYDVLGNEVAILENGNKSAGTYSYNFDAKNLSSGMYFYTIRSGDFVQTKKMLLMK